MLHPRLRFRTSAQTQKRFPFQIKQVLFGNLRAAREPAATQNMSQFFADKNIVSRNVAALLGSPQAEFHQRETLFARHRNISSGRTR